MNKIVPPVELKAQRRQATQGLAFPRLCTAWKTGVGAVCDKSRGHTDAHHAHVKYPDGPLEVVWNA